MLIEYSATKAGLYGSLVHPERGLVTSRCAFPMIGIIWFAFLLNPPAYENFKAMSFITHISHIC